MELLGDRHFFEEDSTFFFFMTWLIFYEQLMRPGIYIQIELFRIIIKTIIRLAFILPKINGVPMDPGVTIFLFVFLFAQAFSIDLCSEFNSIFLVFIVQLQP